MDIFINLIEFDYQWFTRWIITFYHSPTIQYMGPWVSLVYYNCFPEAVEVHYQTPTLPKVEQGILSWTRGPGYDRLIIFANHTMHGPVG